MLRPSLEGAEPAPLPPDPVRWAVPVAGPGADQITGVVERRLSRRSSVARQLLCNLGRRFSTHKMRNDGVPALVARVLLSIIFLVSGVSKLTDWSGTAGFMAAQGIPLVPVVLALTILCEVGGGALLLLGLETRAASLLLFLFLIPVTLVFHRFWTATGAARAPQMASFLKNLAIMGGLAEVYAYGAGRFSLDHLRARTPRKNRFETPAPGHHVPA